jgi:signal transduction histidine kinase
LLQKFGSQFEEYDSLEAAFEGAQRIQQVIDKTLSLARPTPPILKPERVNDIVERTLWFVRIAVQQKQLKVESTFEEHLPSITIDANQIQQAILNIVQNAIDASPQGGIIHVATYCEHCPQEHCTGDGTQRPSVVVAVSDQGAGIPAGQLKRLFEPFRTTKPAGTGLGLTLTKYIIDRHVAHIEIHSSEGNGTTVFLKFPVSINEGEHHDPTSSHSDRR